MLSSSSGDKYGHACDCTPYRASTTAQMDFLEMDTHCFCSRGYILNVAVWLALLKGRGLANIAVHHFHSLLNDGSYQQILEEADETFRAAQGPNDTVNFLAAVHGKLGAAQSERLSNINVNATTNGTFVITTYQTRFDRGAAVETFTWTKTGNALRLRG